MPILGTILALLAGPACASVTTLDLSGLDGLEVQALSSDPTTRLRAIRIIGSTGDPRAVNALMSALKQDSDPEVTWAAAKALTSVGRASIGPLCAALRETLQTYYAIQERIGEPHRKEDSGGPWRRWCAAWALAHLSCPVPADSLILGLNSRDWAVRTEAGLALAKRGPDAGRLLARSFDSLPPMSQARALWILGEAHDREAVRPALQVSAGPLRSDTLFEWQSEVERLAVRSLSELGRDGCQMAVGLLEGPESLDADRAVSILGRVGKTAVPALISALTNRNHRVRWAAAGRLEQLGDPAALVPLARQMDDSLRYIAEEAARRVARLGGMKAEGLLAERLHDKRPRMRSIAAGNLARIGSRRALGPLTSALSDTSWRIRAGASEDFGLLGDTSAIPALRLLENDPVWEVRNHSLWARGKLGDSTAAERLIAQCKEPRQSQPEFVRHALDALSHINTRRVTKALIEMMDDQSGQYKVDKNAVVAILAVRPGSDVTAALAAQYARHLIRVDDTTLVRIGPEVADAVAAEMDSAHGTNRIEHAKLLHRIRDRRGQVALSAILMDTTEGDTSQWMRAAAARAIAELGDKGFGTALLSARRVPGWGRSEIYKTLGKLKYPGTTPALLSDLRVDPAMRGDIVGALGELHDVSALPTLDSLAATGEVRSRVQAARIALRMAPGSAVPRLISFLAEENYWLVAQAADMLGEAGDPRAIEPLVLLLNDKNSKLGTVALSEIRTAALSALARIPTRHAADEVLRYLHSSKDNWDWYRAYPAAVRRNEVKSEGRLVKLLLEHGNEAMAKEYAESANQTLRDAARLWLIGQEWAWRWYDMTRPPPMLR